MAAFPLIIFTVIWSSFVLFFDGVVGNGVVKQSASNHFQSVAGVVVTSKIRSHTSRKHGTTYSAYIGYRYEVAGKSFNGDRSRFINSSSSRYQNALDMVNAHPPGSDITVYYNPQDPTESLLRPGVAGSDFLMGLFLTPFNAGMFGFWILLGGSLRERLFRPVAGGMKIIPDKGCTRVRVPQFSAIFWAIGALGVLGFVSIFVVGFSTQMRPSIPVALLSMTVVYLASAGVYMWQWRKINSGIDDLIIHEFQKSLELPLTYGRKERITVNIADVETVWVEKKIHTSSKGNVSYTYAPTLRMPKKEPSFQKLADWADKLKADDFAAWLGKKINVPTSDS